MAEKFWTTNRKKMAVVAGLAISGWHVVTMGANPLNIPALPAMIGNPLLGGFSLLTVAGMVTLFAIWMVLTDY